MDMLISVLLFAAGLVLLIKGGDWFVDGATGIAKRFNLPDLVVGATVVSIGTTLPEVMVSTTGALQDSGAMAYGNAIGSIICNTALIAAISIAVNPGPVNVKSMKTPVIFFFGSSLSLNLPLLYPKVFKKLPQILPPRSQACSYSNSFRLMCIEFNISIKLSFSVSVNS